MFYRNGVRQESKTTGQKQDTVVEAQLSVPALNEQTCDGGYVPGQRRLIICQPAQELLRGESIAPLTLRTIGKQAIQVANRATGRSEDGVSYGACEDFAPNATSGWLDALYPLCQ